MAEPPQALSLYIHVPFCLSKCPYCDFNTYQSMDQLMGPYVEAASQEMSLWSDRLGRPNAATVFFGGGTPSYLASAQLSKLLSAAVTSFPLIEGPEITAEANPGDLDSRKLNAMLSMGINRLSIGVQSLDNPLLSLLGRRHTAQEAVAAYCEAQQAGFNNISLDLMYGLPRQSMEHWQTSVQQVLELASQHLSLYGLTLEGGTPMERQVAQGQLPEPDPDLAADMYLHAQDALATAGYQQYEISNWCLPGYQSRHNLAYWRVQPYLGIGPGAHSNLEGVRFHNVRLPSQYAQSVRHWASDSAVQCATLGEADLKAISPVAGYEITDPRTAMAETMILGLRLLEGIDLDWFQERHNTSMAEVYVREIEELVAQGLLEMDARRLKLTSRGLLLSNQVFVRFVG